MTPRPLLGPALRTLRVTLALGVAVAWSTFGALTAPVPAVAATFSETTVWAAGERGNDPHHVYGLVATPGGTVLAFAESRIGSEDYDPHDIVLKRSLDGGRTWQPNQVLLDGSSGRAWGNPTPVVDRGSGDVFLFYAETFQDPGNTGCCPDSSRVYVKRSTDDGASWSAGTEVTGRFGNPYGWTFHLPGPGHGIQLDDGRLVVQVWHRRAIAYAVPDRRYSVSVLTSDDGGSTWQAGGIVAVDARYPANESRLFQRSDGAVVLNARYAVSGQHSRIMSVSTDRGASWSAPVLDQALPAATAVDSGLVRYSGGPDAGSANRLLFSRPDDPTTRRNMTVYLSYDEGRTFRSKRVVNTGSSYYSDLVVLPDRSIVLLYGRDGTHPTFPSRVVAARFDLDWLTQGADNGTGDATVLKDLTELGTLAGLTSSGDPASVVQDANARGGALLNYRATAVGDWVELPFDVATAGTYRLQLTYKKSANRATFQTRVDGSVQGPSIDPASTTADAYTTYDLGTRSLGAGTHRIRFTVTGKSAASTGFALLPDHLTLTAP